MKEKVIKIVGRLSISEVFTFMIASVILKLFLNEETWLLKAILWTVSSILAYLIRIYQCVRNEKNLSNIINIKTKKKQKKKLDRYEVLLETIFITFIIGVIYSFIIGVLLELNDWYSFARGMLFMFSITYYLSYYLVNV